MHKNTSRVNNFGNALGEPLPPWALLILKELKALREEIAGMKTGRDYSMGYAEFIDNLRQAMRSDVSLKHYPAIEHEGGIYGITVDGLLYDKTTQRTLSRHEAFRIYKALYARHQKQSLF